MSYLNRMLILLSACILTVGCADDDKKDANNSANNANNANNAANCQTRCVAKGTECEAPSSAASLACQTDVCSTNPSEATLSCIESTSCSTLLNYFVDPDGSLCDLGSGNNENNANNANNVACIAQNKTGCNSGNNPSNCCDDRATCFGNGNNELETICCAPLENGCDSDTDCCNDDNDALPVICVDNACTYAL